mmetsp:Transcript_24148/g.46779  ORF Transcript_24148/g.46779 Transcript_24148/m.46779 type:complete len:278 (+) Transcript_24148:149-982(+)
MPMAINVRADQWGGQLEVLMQTTDMGDHMQPNGRIGGKYVPRQTSLGIQVPYKSGRSHWPRSPPPTSPHSAQMIQWSAVKEISALAQSQPHGRKGPHPAVHLHVPPSGGRIVLNELTRAGREKSISNKGHEWRPPTSYQFGYEKFGYEAEKPHMARYNDKWTPSWTPYITGPAAFTSAVQIRPSAASEGPLSFALSHTRRTPAVQFSPVTDYVSARSRGFSAFSSHAEPQQMEEPMHFKDSKPNPKARPSYNSKMGMSMQGEGFDYWSSTGGSRLPA